MLKFLLIDDDFLEHKMFDCYLASGQTVDYDLISTSTIEDAIDALAKHSFDFIFLDDRLAPHKSAIETLPMLREHIGAAKIVLISSSIEARHLQDPTALNVLAVMNKFDLKSALSTDMQNFSAARLKKAA